MSDVRPDPAMLPEEAADLPRPHLRGIAERLTREGFDILAAPTMEAIIATHGGSHWADFADSWDDLVPDRFMADGGTYRKRRFACFSLSAEGLRLKAAQPHYQTVEHNRLNGGIARVFGPVSTAILEHTTTRALVEACAAAFGAVRPAERWHIEMHQFRIEARPDAAGQPTPEGLHRDGVEFVLVLMIGRQNVEGGVSVIAGPDRDPITHVTLDAPHEALLLDDRRVFHGVSPIRPVDPGRPSFRDVLVLTFRAENN